MAPPVLIVLREMKRAWPPAMEIKTINMTDRRLTFSRTSDLEEAYIAFFAKMNSRLARGSGLHWKISSPQGQNWHISASLDKSRSDAANAVASFAQKRRLLIELYIDYADKDVNKRLFDSLYIQKGRIEAHFGEPLEWERLDEKRASRIAIYTKAQIFADADNISLIDWAVRNAEQFRSTFESFFPSLGQPTLIRTTIKIKNPTLSRQNAAR